MNVMSEIGWELPLLWFLCGVICSMFSSRILSYVQLAWLFSLVDRSVLAMLAKLQEDIEFSKKIKYRFLESTDMSRAQINDIREVDDKSIEVWKETVIERILGAYPPQFRRIVKYSNWDSAMKSITEHIKNGGL